MRVPGVGHQLARFGIRRDDGDGTKGNEPLGAGAEAHDGALQAVRCQQWGVEVDQHRPSAIGDASGFNGLRETAADPELEIIGGKWAIEIDLNDQISGDGRGGRGERCQTESAGRPHRQTEQSCHPFRGLPRL